MTETPPVLLQLDHLDAWYGEAQVLFDVSLQVQAGEVLALVGRNGAGKSSLLKAIMGLMPRVRGERHYDGHTLAGLASHQIARLGLGYVPETRRIFTDLTVLENLETGRQPPRDGLPAWTPERLFALFPNLGRMPRRRGLHMSGGEQQMLAVARTLMGNPRLLLLDEPSEGVAPIIVDQMAETIVQLKAAGVSVLLSEQNARFVSRVADRALGLDQGSLRPTA